MKEENGMKFEKLRFRFNNIKEKFLMKDTNYFSLYSKDGISRVELFVLIEKQPFAIIITDSNGKIQFANVKALALTGYSSLLNKPFDFLKSESDRNSVSSRDQDQTYFILEHKNGEMIPVFSAVSLITLKKHNYKVYNLFKMSYINDNIQDEANTHMQYYKIYKGYQNQLEDADLFASNIASNAIEKYIEKEKNQEELAKYRIIFDEILESIYLLDKEGKILEANLKSLDVLGLGNSEIKKMNFADTLTEEFRPIFRNRLKEVSSLKEESLIIDQIRKGSDPVSMELRIYSKIIYNQEVIICIARDINNQINSSVKNKADSRDYDQNVLLSAFNLAPSPMFILNNNFEVIKSNHAAILKYNLHETDNKKKFIGQIINCTGDLTNIDGCGANEACSQCEFYINLQECISSGTSITRRDIVIKTKSNENIQNETVQISLAQLGPENENRILVTLDNITDKIKIEDELSKAKEAAEVAERLKTNFVNNLSHEIRTPLNGIMGFSDILLNSTSPEDIRKFAQIINKSGKRLLNIFEDLFTVASVQSGTIKIKKRELSLSNLLEDIKLLLYEELIASEKQINIELKFNFPGILKDLKILVDPALLITIIRHLARNAYKFTPEGIVEFGLLNVEGNEKTFYVKDSGIGIEKEKQNLIFEFFRQGNEYLSKEYHGIGTGLSIARSLVELTGGKIWVDSSKDEGSTFYFTITDELLENQTTKEIISTKETALIGKNILIVEDHDDNYELYKILLQEEGVNAIRAKTGEEAIKIVRAENVVHFVLMDLKLPGISGFETTRQLLKIKPDLKILAQSALTSSDDIDNALKCGCIDFLEKPTNNLLLIEKIKKLIVLD